MKEELEKKLFKKYEFLRTQGIQNDAMFFGMQCGDGWYKLLDNLFNKMQKYFNKHPDAFVTIWKIDKEEQKEYFKVTTVKEKFSTLRVYTSWSLDELDKMIQKAEDDSEYTCESCGKVCKEKTAYKEVSPGGWQYNMCDICWNKFLKERNKK